MTVVMSISVMTSSENSVIYKFTNGSISKWIEGEEISSPNGLCISNNKLFVGKFR